MQLHRSFVGILLILLLFYNSSRAGSDRSSNDFTSLSADSILSYLSVLASDSLEGREAGKEGQRKAAAFLSSLYERWNVPAPPGGKRLQNHPLGIKSNKSFNLKASGTDYLFYRDFYYLPGKPDTSFILNKLLFAGYGHSLDELNELKNCSPENKAVLIHAEAMNSGRSKKLPNVSLIEKLNALSGKNPALVFVSVDSLYPWVERLENDQPFADSILQLSFRTVFIEKKHAAQIVDTAGLNLEAKLEKINKKGRPQSEEIGLQILLNTLNNTDQLIGQNVFGFIEGTDLKNEIVVLSAHYDHLGVKKNEIYYGADDDGSGTSAIMEMARNFSEEVKKGNRPRRSILFFNTCGEEKGLTGSKWYTQHPFFPSDKVVVNLNTDMIGRIDSIHEAEGNPDYLYIISSFGDSQDLISYNEEINKQTANLTLDYKYSNPSDPNAFYRRSDHYNFVKKGIPVIFYFNGSHADYHRPTDTVDKINFPVLTKRAQLIFNTAHGISYSPILFHRPDKTE